MATLMQDTAQEQRAMSSQVEVQIALEESGPGQNLDEIVHCLLLCSRREGAPSEGGRLRDCWKEDSQLGAEGWLANGLRDTQAGCQRTNPPDQSA